MVDDPRIALVSATGSTAMGRAVGPRVAQRFGRVLLELGGNNSMIVCPSADLEMATQSIFFGAVGTAGQRCTSTRRVIMHESVADKVREKLLVAYKTVPIGHPYFYYGLSSKVEWKPRLDGFILVKEMKLK